MEKAGWREGSGEPLAGSEDAAENAVMKNFFSDGKYTFLLVDRTPLTGSQVFTSAQMVTEFCTEKSWQSLQRRGRINCLRSCLWFYRPGVTLMLGRTCDGPDRTGIACSAEYTPFSTRPSPISLTPYTTCTVVFIETLDRNTGLRRGCTPTSTSHVSAHCLRGGDLLSLADVCTTLAAVQRVTVTERMKVLRLVLPPQPYGNSG